MDTDKKPGKLEQQFLSWWKDDPERAKCTLTQAVGAYVSSFPGRMASLLVELLGGDDEDNKQPRRGFFQ